MARFNDIFTQSQPHSVFTCSKTASDRTFPNGDLISSFQRNFCSNFVCICCYVHLPSLHDLFDHVEEAHVGPNGGKSWPPIPLSPSANPKPVMTDYPPQSFLLFQTAYSSPEPTGDFSSYEDTFRLNYATTCDAENLPQCPPLRHPLSRFERPCAQLSTPLEPQYESFVGPIRSRLRNVHRRVDDVPIPQRTASSKVQSPEPSPNKPACKRKKEPFQCPIAGCTKSYRNANGLKYHREKGKCLFDGDDSADLQLPAISATLAPQKAPARPRSLASAKRTSNRRSTRYPARPLTRTLPLNTVRAQSPLSSSSSSSPISPITPPQSPYSGTEAVYLDEHSFEDTSSVITVDGVLSFNQQPKLPSAERPSPLLSSSSRHQTPSFFSRSLSPLTICISRSASPDIAAPSPCVLAPAELLERLNEMAASACGDRDSLEDEHELAESDYERCEVMDMVSESIGEGAGDNFPESEFQILQTLLVDDAGLGAPEGERADFC